MSLLEFNLEMMIVARCAPGHSRTYLDERIMFISNIGLQHCALKRPDGSKFEEMWQYSYG